MKVIKKIWIWLVKLRGWKLNVPEKGSRSEVDRCVFVVAPHTSALDFIYGAAFLWACSENGKVMIKKEFFFWPLGSILRACGAVPVNQKTASTTVKSLISLMEDVPEFHLAIAPEGTRKAVKRWKTGFHLIARETGSTVYMGYFDWGTKHISVGEKIELTDDVKADMQRIYDHYRPMGLQGKHKDGFIVP